MKARYRILAVVTEKKVLALSLDSRGVTTPVSINGNPCMYYESAGDMESFLQYIKDDYSINDFDDDDFALIVVDCGQDGTAAKRLHALTLKAKCSSLIEAEYVLPFIAARKRAIKKGDEFAVTVEDAAYTLHADDEGRIDCARCGTDETPAENALPLDAADFTALFSADINAFGRDAEIAELELQTEYERKLKNIEQGLIEYFGEDKKELIQKLTAESAQPHGNHALLPQPHPNTSPIVTPAPAAQTTLPSDMVFVEGGMIDMPDSEEFNGIKVESFYMAATPVTMQEYFDVTEKVPDAILGMYAVQAGLLKTLDPYAQADACAMSHDDLNETFSNLKTHFYLETPEIDKEHFVQLQKGGTLLLPKTALADVDAILRSKYKFLAWEDFIEQALDFYGRDVPVTHVSIKDQVFFCNQKSKKDGLDEIIKLTEKHHKSGPVTAAEYLDVVGRTPENELKYNIMFSKFNTKVSYEVYLSRIHISDEDMQYFCEKKTQKDGISYIPAESLSLLPGRYYYVQCYELVSSNKQGYYIPTSAKWIYAANGGKDQQSFQYAGSDDLDAVAWYADNTGGKLHPVAQKQPNTIGLYDMSGNIWETTAVDNANTFYEFGGSACNPSDIYSLSVHLSIFEIDGYTGFRICKSCGGRE
ncbi:MAG: formylglycine-generating enzyme family protein [Treponema sp.]